MRNAYPAIFVVAVFTWISGCDCGGTKPSNNPDDGCTGTDCSDLDALDGLDIPGTDGPDSSLDIDPGEEICAVLRELSDALGALSTAERRLELAARRVDLAEEALDQANRSFAAEVITNLDVLEAQTALRGAQAGRVRAALTLNRAGWRVRRLLDDL